MFESNYMPPAGQYPPPPMPGAMPPGAMPPPTTYRPEINPYPATPPSNNQSSATGNTIGDTLRYQKGRRVIIKCTVPGSNKWLDTEYRGIVDGAENDYVIINDLESRIRTMLPMWTVVSCQFLEDFNCRC